MEASLTAPGRWRASDSKKPRPCRRRRPPQPRALVQYALAETLQPKLLEFFPTAPRRRRWAGLRGIPPTMSMRNIRLQNPPHPPPVYPCFLPPPPTGEASRADFVRVCEEESGLAIFPKPSFFPIRTRTALPSSKAASASASNKKIGLFYIAKYKKHYTNIT
jgi:hypothetical protein